MRLRIARALSQVRRRKRRAAVIDGVTLRPGDHVLLVGGQRAVDPPDGYIYFVKDQGRAGGGKRA